MKSMLLIVFLSIGIIACDEGGRPAGEDDSSSSASSSSPEENLEDVDSEYYPKEGDEDAYSSDQAEVGGKDEGKFESSGSQDATGEDDLKQSVNELRDVLSGGSSERQGKVLSCELCSKEFVAEKGWFHNDFLSQGEIGCMRYNDYVLLGSPKYCSMKCCGRVN